MLIATGGNKATAGFGVAASLGHTILEPVPSLFTFNIDDARLRGLEGISATDAEVSIEGNKDRRRGPVLVTHWGLSGPAVLKLSAWAARDLHDRGYDFDLNVNWAAGYPKQEVERLLANSRRSGPGRPWRPTRSSAWPGGCGNGSCRAQASRRKTVGAP